MNEYKELPVHKQIEYLENIIKENIDIDGQDDYLQDTLLIKSSQYGDINGVALLLKYGANPNIKNMYGDNALGWAVCMYYIEIIEMLLEHKLIDINQQNNYGCTALMVASQYGLYKIIKILIKAGADTNLKNIDCDTALTIPIEKNKYKTIKLLTSVIVLVPMFHKRYRRMSKDIIREAASYF
jgi:ankyrin repeat protein